MSTNINVNITGTISNLQQALDQAKGMIEGFSPNVRDPKTTTPFNTSQFMGGIGGDERKKMLGEINKLKQGFLGARDSIKKAGYAQSVQKSLLESTNKVYSQGAQNIMSKYNPAVDFLGKTYREASKDGQFFGKTAADIQKGVRSQQDPMYKAKTMIDDWNSSLPSLQKNLQQSGLGMNKLGGVTDSLNKEFMGKLIPAVSKADPVLGTYLKEVVKAGQSTNFLTGNQKALNSGLDAYYKKQNMASSAREYATRKDEDGRTGLGKTGMKLQWFGFRLAMVGRLFERSIGQALNNVLKQFTQWDKTIESIGQSLGFLASRGLISSDTFGTMIETMQELPETGQMIESIFGLVATLFAQIGNDIIPVIGPAIIDLLSSLMRLWEGSKDKVIPIFEKLANETIPKLIEILEKYGGGFIEGFFSGFEKGVTFITQIIDVLGPFLPTIGEFLGGLIALSPIIATLGMGIFLLSIPLGIIDGLLGGVTFIAKGLALAFTDVSAGAIGAGPGVQLLAGVFQLLQTFMLPIIVIIGTLITWWNELSAGFMNTVVPAFKNLFAAIGNLLGGLGGLIDIWAIVKLATAPVATLFLIMFKAIGFVVDVVASLVWWLGEALKVLKPVGDALGGIVEAATKPWSALNGWLSGGEKKDEGDTNPRTRTSTENDENKTETGTGGDKTVLDLENMLNNINATPTIDSPKLKYIQDDTVRDKTALDLENMFARINATPTIDSPKLQSIQTDMTAVSTSITKLSDSIIPAFTELKAVSLETKDINASGFSGLLTNIQTYISDVSASITKLSDSIIPTFIELKTVLLETRDINTSGFAGLLTNMQALIDKPNPPAPITVEMSIVIENVTSDVDINNLADEVSKKITDGIQRVRII